MGLTRFSRDWDKSLIDAASRGTMGIAEFERGESPISPLICGGMHLNLGVTPRFA